MFDICVDYYGNPVDLEMTPSSNNPSQNISNQLKPSQSPLKALSNHVKAHQEQKSFDAPMTHDFCCFKRIHAA